MIKSTNLSGYASCVGKIDCEKVEFFKLVDRVAVADGIFNGSEDILNYYHVCGDMEGVGEVHGVHGMNNENDRFACRKEVMLVNTKKNWNQLVSVVY